VIELAASHPNLSNSGIAKINQLVDHTADALAQPEPQGLAMRRLLNAPIDNRGYVDLRERSRPEPQGPTLDDVSALCEEFGFHLDESYDNLESVDALWKMFRAVLARWGNQ
jgi:hypothetical protein